MSSIAIPPTAPTPTKRATLSRVLARVTRTQLVVLLLLATLGWVAATTYFAAEEGAHRRMTFDGVVKR
jgi:hypothetical protein